MHDEVELPPDSTPMIRTVAMPANSNANGDIFGGWLMSQMDLGGSNLASRIAQGRIATVAVDGMSFIRPVKIGDEVSVYATLVSIGHTSIKINVEAWRRRPDFTPERRVTKAVFTFVAINADGKPRPVKPE